MNFYTFQIHCFEAILMFQVFKLVDSYMVASFTHCYVTAAALVVLFCPMDGPLQQLSDSVISAWDHTVCTLCALRFD